MELKYCINFLLRTAQHKVFQEMSLRMDKFEMTPLQYAIMDCLWTKGAKQPKEIAQELHMEHSTLSGLLEKMEKKDLIERKMIKEDRRKIEVVLTERGNQLKNPVLQEVEKANKEILLLIPPNKQTILKQSLWKLSGIPSEN